MVFTKLRSGFAIIGDTQFLLGFCVLLPSYSLINTPMEAAGIIGGLHYVDWQDNSDDLENYPIYVSVDWGGFL
ncbi:hypothetical protein PAENIP36_39420 [Paenibacillus sp. P36]